MFYLLKFFKTNFLKWWVSEVVVLKMWKLLLNLFQIDRLINEMHFWPKLLYSQVSPIPNLVQYYMYFERGQKVHLHKMVRYPSNIWKLL